MARLLTGALVENGFALTMDGLKAWCDRNNIQYAVNDELGQLGIPTPLGQGFLLRVIPRPSRQMLTLALPLPLRIAPALRQEVARATALANSTSFMGCWVLNHQQGELYFRVSVPTEGVLYDDTAVLYLMNVVVGTVRGLGNGFRRIIADGAPAESILDAAQSAAKAAPPTT